MKAETPVSGTELLGSLQRGRRCLLARQTWVRSRGFLRLPQMLTYPAMCRIMWNSAARVCPFTDSGLRLAPLAVGVTTHRKSTGALSLRGIHP